LVLSARDGQRIARNQVRVRINGGKTAAWMTGWLHIFAATPSSRCANGPSNGGGEELLPWRRHELRAVPVFALLVAVEGDGGDGLT
jgi:hypothetical protein